MKLDKSGEVTRYSSPLFSAGIALPVLDAPCEGLVVYVGRRLGGKVVDPSETVRAIQEIARRLELKENS